MLVMQCLSIVTGSLSSLLFDRNHKCTSVYQRTAYLSDCGFSGQLSFKMNLPLMKTDQYIAR